MNEKKNTQQQHQQQQNNYGETKKFRSLVCVQNRRDATKHFFLLRDYRV